MIPPGFASPNPLLNATPIQGKSFIAKCAILGVGGPVELYVEAMNSVPSAPVGTPRVTIATATEMGVLSTDAINLIDQVGNNVAESLAILAPGDVNSIITFYLERGDSSATANGAALSALANIAGVNAALKAALGN